MRIIVYHSLYGCETGCCGHTVEVDGKRTFEFSHPDSKEEFKEYAEDLVRRNFGDAHVKDLDWENCQILDYDDCF